MQEAERAAKQAKAALSRRAPGKPFVVKTGEGGFPDGYFTEEDRQTFSSHWPHMAAALAYMNSSVQELKSRAHDFVDGYLRKRLGKWLNKGDSDRRKWTNYRFNQIRWKLKLAWLETCPNPVVPGHTWLVSWEGTSIMNNPAFLDRGRGETNYRVPMLYPTLEHALIICPTRDTLRRGDVVNVMNSMELGNPDPETSLLTITCDPIKLPSTGQELFGKGMHRRMRVYLEVMFESNNPRKKGIREVKPPR